MTKYDPKIAEVITDIKSTIPEEVKDLVSDLSFRNPVSNLNRDYLLFKDSSVFTPAANEFDLNESKGNTCYTTAIPGSSQYYKYWQEQKDRCLNGFTIGGVYITGEHYFYLNFCRIEKTVTKPDGRETKELGFPNFVSMDYYYFLELELCENPVKFGKSSKDKKGIILAKARRKGFSFKNAAGAVWIYTFFSKSRVVIAAEIEDKAINTFNMAKNMCNFLNEYTEFRHSKLKDTQTFIRSGWMEKINGQDVEKGFLSEIKILTLKDNPDKSAGLSCTRFIFEEGGLINMLKKAYRFAEPTLRDGETWIGIPIIFGTGGDMEGSTQDFAEMHNSPSDYGLAEYDNIYEENETQSKSGLFVDEMWFRPGASYVDENGKLHVSMDKNGNSFRWVAELSLDKERKVASKGSKEDYDVSITQKCKTPTEAFLKPEGNVFPVALLKRVKSRLKMNNRYKNIGVPGKLERTRDPQRPIKFIPDRSLEPIYSYPHKKSNNAESAVMIYQSPPETDYPSEMYKIGYDPVKFDVDNKSAYKSLASLIVYKGYQKFDHGYDEIVAEYTGRYESTDDINEVAMMLSMYYGNAKIMHENEIGKDVMAYFHRKGKVHLLEHQPDSAMGKVIKNSKVSRVYGAPMNDKMKGACEKWCYNWLMIERGISEEGETIFNLDLIPSLGLIEELMAYSRSGNFDRVMALFQLMLVIEEYKEEEFKEKNVNTIASQLLNRLENK
jgi:hypothetical protein